MNNAHEDHDHVASDYRDDCGHVAMRAFWQAAWGLCVVLGALFLVGMCVVMAACQASSRIDGGKASLEATTTQEDPTTTEVRETLHIVPPEPMQTPEPTQWRIVIHPPPEKPK